MSCFDAQKFLSRVCCSCGSKDSNDGEVEITKISTKNSLNDTPFRSKDTNVHKEHSRESTGNGNDNPAYQDDITGEEIVCKSRGDKIVREQPRFNSSIAYERQVSDVSNLSDFAPQTGKELSEMVMEGLERSCSSVSTVKHLERSFHGREPDAAFAETGLSDSSEPIVLCDDSKAQIRVDETKDIPGVVEPLDTYQPTSQNVKDPPTSKDPSDKNLEWRKKLMEDLDDDEEFLSSSDESDVEITGGDEPADDQAVDESPKFTNGLPQQVSISSATSKCGGIPAVLDMGSYEIKAGTAGDYKPTHTCRNVLGKWRPQVGEAYSEAYGDILYGDDALLKHNALTLHNTLQDGIVTDWSNFQSICDWTLCRCLDVDIKEHPLLFIEQSLVSKSQREKTLEVLMEALHCPMLQFRQQAVLSALYAGSDVGLVVNSGHSCTEVVPVYYGYPIHHAIRKVGVGGQHITEYLGRLLLRERGINFSSVADFEILDSVKRTYAQFTNDEHPAEKQRNRTIQHELPDGGVLELGDEVYKCTDPLYSPHLIGNNNGLGLLEAVKGAVGSLDPELSKEMASSVILTGGNCGLNGFSKHLSDRMFQDNERTKSTSETICWGVSKCDDIIHSSWIGGSVFADRDDFRDSCITDDMYFEFGPTIVHRMCI